MPDQTPTVTARVPREIMTAARMKNPELANADNSVIIRVAIAVMAGIPLAVAIHAMAKGNGIKIEIPADVLKT